MASKADTPKVDKISFDGDSRVQWLKANLNGRNYGIYHIPAICLYIWDFPRPHAV